MSRSAARSLTPGQNSPEVEAAFESAPPGCVVEIIDGELHTMPRPRATHSRAASRLGRYIGQFDDDEGPSGWILLDEPELHLGPMPDKVVPDLAGWRRERMPELPDVAAFTLAPDWVCEVLSESTEAIDRGKKLRIYRREGVGHVWLVNPTLRTLEVYRLTQGQWMLVDTHEGEDAVRAEPFESIELPLARLWAR
jgi:Uma2 family endonuclease